MALQISHHSSLRFTQFLYIVFPFPLQSTGSFFHDRSTTLGTLMGVTFPAITFRAPSLSQHRQPTTNTAVENSVGDAGRRSKKSKKIAAMVTEQRWRRRRWWTLCSDYGSKPSSLGEFLEVERRFGDGAFFGAAAELEGVDIQPGNKRSLFADGRVLPPVDVEEEGSSTAASLCRFPVSLTGICSGGSGG
ncbi:unnamed protein product [Ilex paraguariensis]|uniref:Uncharacterized protein n=1 Tax=Ilex paraguariensis TaxID=185542 RepID=A0ABC8TBN6_9AQUA